MSELDTDNSLPDLCCYNGFQRAGGNVGRPRTCSALGREKVMETHERERGFSLPLA